MRKSKPQIWSSVARRFLFGSIVLAVAASSQSTTGDAAEKSRGEWKQQYHRPTSVPYPDENPYTREKANLGAKLFFDPRLSGSNSISCASCHNPSFAWGDGLPTGFGHGMTRLGRRTPTILNLAWGELMMWDGRFEDLEEQAFGPMGADVEMNQDLTAIVSELLRIPGYRTQFKIAFPGEGITLENIAKAIATYERTVVSGVAPFDRWTAGNENAITNSAKRGFDLFNGKANCVSCHQGWNFTDDSFHDIGLPDGDIGRGKIVTKSVKMQHAFKTPTLREVAFRAPYMHDGSLPNLGAVVDHYANGSVRRASLSDEIKPFTLTDQEKADLVAFMLTLNGEDQKVVIPRLPPNQPSIADILSRVSPSAGPGAQSGGMSDEPGCKSARQHWLRCGY